MNYIQTLRQHIGTSPILAPGSAILVMNDANELLLQLRADTNDWGLPGGGMEMGDSSCGNCSKGAIRGNWINRATAGIARISFRKRVLL